MLFTGLLLVFLVKLFIIIVYSKLSKKKLSRVKLIMGMTSLMLKLFLIKHCTKEPRHTVQCIYVHETTVQRSEVESI